MSLYKVGDIVTIKPRQYPSDDYPCGFSDGMIPFVGESLKIVAVKSLTCYLDRPQYNGDPYFYELQGNYYNWHSSMFEEKKDLSKNSFCFKVYKHKKLEITLWKELPLSLKVR